MALLSPWFLLGALAVGLPLWLHLLQRQNPLKLPFSSLMFFERRQHSSLRERRLRYLLLLAARLALLVLAALAFSKPIWERPPAAMAGQPAKLHLIVLDTSLSMNYADRWQRAAAEAESIVEQMAPNDRGQVLAAGPGVSVQTQAIQDREELKQAIRALRPTHSSNSYAEVAEAVNSLTPEGDMAVAVHLVSDMQQSAMPGRFSDLSLPAMASLAVHNVAEPNPENWSIESIKGATRIYGGQKPRLEVTVASFGDKEATKDVRLSINGQQVASQSARVPGAGRASIVFESFEVPRGFSRGEIALQPADALPQDDRRLIVLDNSEPEPILFLSNDPRRRDVLYYKSALDASSEAVFRVESASPGETQRLIPDDFALVVISDIPQLATLFDERLKKYVESGGAVLIAAGPKISSAEKAPLFAGAIAAAPYAGSARDFQLIGAIDDSHPILRQVKRFRGVKVFRHALLSAGAGDDVFARLSDGSPLLVEQKLGNGRVMLLASSLDNVWNDLPVHPVFVPFVVESARYLSGLEERPGQAIVDSVLELRERRSSGAAVQVFDPRGGRALSLEASIFEQVLPLPQVGFWEVRRTGETELFAVNPDPRESNLRPMEADALELWKATGRQETAAGLAGSEESAIKPPPIEIWRLLLALLALAVLIESILGNRHLNVRREA